MPAFDAVVHEVVPETPDTVTLVLEPSERFEYSAGQFLSIDPHQLDATRALAKELEERKGRKERARPYSLASAPHEPYLAITIKEEHEGEFPSLLSPYLCRGAKAGDVIPCVGFNGLYTLPQDLPEGAHVVHVCAGSGIVPNWGIMKDALHRHLPVKQTLLFSNRTWGDVIYRDLIREVAAKHPDEVRVIHALTRDPECPSDVACRPGRITEALVRDVAPDLENAWFYVCGPSIPVHERRAARERGEKPASRFLESMKALLDGMAIPKQRIYAEGW